MSDSDRPTGTRPGATQWSNLFPTDPRRVGDDPDYRFTLANERTFLAWIRTALALAGGGLAAATLLDEIAHTDLLGVGLVALAFVTAGTAYRRWALNERAMRTKVPLPHSRLPMLMAVSVAIVSVGVTVVIAIETW